MSSLSARFLTGPAHNHVNTQYAPDTHKLLQTTFIGQFFKYTFLLQYLNVVNSITNNNLFNS